MFERFLINPHGDAAGMMLNDVPRCISRHMSVSYGGIRQARKRRSKYVVLRPRGGD